MEVRERKLNDQTGTFPESGRFSSHFTKNFKLDLHALEGYYSQKTGK